MTARWCSATYENAPHLIRKVSTHSFIFTSPLLLIKQHSHIINDKMNLPHGSRLYLVCLHLAVGASIWGYNIGILSSILVHPGWREALHSPTPSQKGSVTGLYYFGTLVSYLFVSHPLADKLGRRYAALIGTGILSLGALIMASAVGDSSVSIMVFGRIVCGFGVGIVSTGVPLYQRCAVTPLNHELQQS